MTTAADFNTPDRLIRTAMENAKLLAEGQEPSSEQYAKYLNRISDLVNYWQTKGLKLWLNLDLSITLTASLATYTLGPTGTVVMTRPTRILPQGYYLDANDIRRPIDLLTWNEYIRLSQVTSEGPITGFFVDKQQTYMSVKFWLTPDTEAATGTAHLIIQQQITNPISITETMNFPLEWFLALHWGLAAEICSGQPEAIVQRCELKARETFAALEDWDVEDGSTSFAPDATRSGYSTGGFR